MSLEELNKDERYRIEGRVGAGAMATVYKAYDLRLQRIVALKILHEHLSNQTELRMRFEQEAKLAARIDHPNVVRIYDFGTTSQGQLFIVSEFVDGRSLTLAQRKYSSQPSPALHPVLAALVALEIAKGIEAAHKHAVVHRDLKPDNVLVHSNGEVKLTDFGVARPFDSSMTQAGQFIGSLTYASPEQIQSGKVDARSDIFSFGVIFFELLTGQLPFRSSNPTDLAVKITQANVPPLNLLKPAVPLDLDVIVRRCLRVDPAQRPQSAEQIVADLIRFLKTQEVVPSKRVIADGFENPMLFASTIQRSPLLQDETKISTEAATSTRQEKVKKADVELRVTPPRSSEGHFAQDQDLEVDLAPLKQRELTPPVKKARINPSVKQNPPQPVLAQSPSRQRKKKRGLLTFFMLTLTVSALILAFVVRKREHLQDYLSNEDPTPTSTVSPHRANETVTPIPTLQAQPAATEPAPAAQKTQPPKAPTKAPVKMPVKTATKPPTKLNTSSPGKTQKPAFVNKPRRVRPAPTPLQGQPNRSSKNTGQPLAKPTATQATPSPVPTQLVLRTEPGEMTVYINGVFEGLSSRSGLTRTFIVPAGNVLLHIPQQEHNGRTYQEYKKRLRIEPGKTLELPAINLTIVEPETKKE